MRSPLPSDLVRVSLASPAGADSADASLGASPIDGQPIYDRDLAQLVREAGVRLNVPEELSRRFARLWLGWLPDHSSPAGFILVWVVADELHVIDVATRPAARRRGVAEALLSHVLRGATAASARIALLEVRASNTAAISLYRKLGFVESNVRRRYYADGEDAVEMVLDLQLNAALADPGVAKTTVSRLETPRPKQTI